MDGSAGVFLCEMPLISSVMDRESSGILYVEDFDAEKVDDLVKHIVHAPAESLAPLLTQADLEAACDAGRRTGMQEALANAHFVQAQCHTAAVHNLTVELQAKRVTLEGIAVRYADECSRAILAVLQAAIPVTLAQNAVFEIEGVVRALASSLVCEPQLSVRANPASIDVLLTTVTECLPKKAVAFSVVDDPELSIGEVHVAWHDAKASRNYHLIWDRIRAALTPLNLPSLDEVYCADRN